MASIHLHAFHAAQESASVVPAAARWLGSSMQLRCIVSMAARVREINFMV